MVDLIHDLIARYGLAAVFIGCLAEGESAATLAGFFAHQSVFRLDAALAVVFAGAFIGDAVIYEAGRRSASFPILRSVTAKPGFSSALAVVQRNPVKSALLNRYIYGMRFLGCLAVGAAGVPARVFYLCNAASAVVWTGLFCGLGYVFGAGAETLIDAELAKHERLLAALGIAAGVALCVWLAARHRGSASRPR